MAGRSFTNVEHISEDREVLIYMARQVCMVLETDIASLQGERPIYVDEPDGRWHRYFIPSPMTLLNAQKIYVVGFFGQKKNEIPSDYLGDLSDRLVERIPSYPEILSYSTMALKNGDFSNLVLLSNEEVKLKWMDGGTHNKAVERSSGYYLSVRINNGVLSDGVLQPDSLCITQVKYCDYRESPAWKAERLLSKR